MRIQNSGRAAVVCIAVLFAFFVVPAGCLMDGGVCSPRSAPQNERKHSAGDFETCIAGAYGVFCVCDSSGRTYDVCAACFVQEDGSAELYLLQGAPSDARLTAKNLGTGSLVIDTVRWFVSERWANPEAFLGRIPVRAIYEQRGTLQTIGDEGAPARLIWAES